MSTVLLIPAYDPDEKLLKLLEELLSRKDCPQIVIVNDGSHEKSAFVFDSIRKMPGIRLLTHSVNMGKGAALKTGLNGIYSEYPEASGIITADSDGQHTPEDIFRLADFFEKQKNTLVLGVRKFDGDVPLRSRFGNRMTSFMMKLFLGLSISDTQTGLRAIPRDFIPGLLKIAYNRYEFELEMILLARSEKRRIAEMPIRTIYIDNNASSHFNPLLDSVKIYFVLFRYILASIVTALTDYLVYIPVLFFTGNIDIATFSGRTCGACVQYLLVRNMVFSSREKVLKTLPKYILLVIVSGCLASIIVKYFQTHIGISAYIGKLAAEGILYLANFAIQRDFIFTKSGAEQNYTDWDKYYDKPPKAAKITRKYLAKKLLSLLKAHTPPAKSPARGLTLYELGGGNSCFYDTLREGLPLSEYHVFDNNELGLEKFKGRLESSPSRCEVFIHKLDLLDFRYEKQADIVFSAGLAEHFTPDATERIIKAHFDLAKPGATVIILFPTPTLLYRITRRLAEVLRMWIFHDERPLKFAEVEKAVTDCGGKILHRETLRRILLTQGVIVTSKPNGGK